MEKLHSGCRRRCQDELDEAAAKVVERQTDLASAGAQVDKLQDTALLTPSSAAAKKEVPEEKVENSKTISELATITVVRIRLKFQARLDNSSARTAQCWGAHHNLGLTQ